MWGRRSARDDAAPAQGVVHRVRARGRARSTIIAAPITPARSPRRLRTIRSAGSPAAASAGRRPRARRPAGARSASEMSPPMTITRRVEEVDARGEHLAELAAGLADLARPPRVAGADERDDVAAVVGLEPRPRAARRRARAPPATASRQPMLPQRQTTSSCAGDPDVPDVAGRALAPRWIRPPATMPQPMPVPTLTNSRCSTSRQFAQCSPSAMMFTSLSTSTGRVVALGEASPGPEKPSQPGMIGGATGPPGGELDRPGHADADAAHVRRVAPGPLEQGVEALLDPVEHGLGAVGDRPVGHRLGEDLAAEVAQREARVGRAEVGREHDAGAERLNASRRAGARRSRPPRRPAAAVRAASSCVDPLRHRRARQPRQLADLHPRARAPLPHQAEDRAGTGGASAIGRTVGGAHPTQSTRAGLRLSSTRLRYGKERYEPTCA